MNTYLKKNQKQKLGVEEMSWGTPSAHSAIQGAISAVLIYHDVSNSWNWIINIIVLLFVMYSRLFLAVHWPQDVVLGAIIGIVCGLIVCSSNIHHSMIEFSTTYSPAGGLVFLCVGTCLLLLFFYPPKKLFKYVAFKKKMMLLRSKKRI